jgi:hypothetical protein
MDSAVAVVASVHAVAALPVTVVLLPSWFLP